MTLFCIVIKILKHFHLCYKPSEQSVTTLLYHHSWSHIAGKPFFHVSSWSATVDTGRHSGDDAVNQQQNVLFIFIYQYRS